MSFWLIPRCLDPRQVRPKEIIILPTWRRVRAFLRTRPHLDLRIHRRRGRPTSRIDYPLWALRLSGVIRLSAADWEVLGEALLNPPPPNPALEKAMERRLRLLNPFSKVMEC